ncbi:Serine/threonine-protein kinase [Chamberlinius hualienensis]
MDRVGDYEYNPKDLIGHGAFAVVFKGRHKKNHSVVVAIKSITKKNLSKSQNLLGKEIKILKELTELHHENVVALMDCKETPHNVFLVMEYCNGGDLADYLHAKGTLSEDTIRLFLRQLAGAMRALNAKGIVHRDLKPQNILLCHTSEKPAPQEIKLKIADFGFARFLQRGVMAATLCGSPMYMAPEVIMSLQYDAKADLWSIGTIVFQCLTGKAPFQAATPQALKQFYEKNVNLTPKISSGTSSELSDLLVKLLKRNAKDRMEFDEFFSHPFLKKFMKPTSPVPVPVRQHSVPREISPVAKRDSPSPFSTCSPPPDTCDLPGDVINTSAALHALPIDHDRFGTPDSNKGQNTPPTEGADGFVFVPSNIPAETSVEYVGTGVLKRKSAETFGSSPMLVGTPPKMSSSPSAGFLLKRYSSPLESPSPRPSYLPVTNSPSSGGGSIPGVPSQPIPVPSQKAAYYQIQQSLHGSPISDSPYATSNSPDSPSRNNKAHLDNYNANVSVPRSPRLSGTDSQESGNKFIPDLLSFNPPSVQFVIGTPPLLARRASNGTPPPSSPWPSPYLQGRHIPSSPVRKSSILSSSPNSNYFFGANYGSNLAALTDVSGNIARYPSSSVPCNTFASNLTGTDFNKDDMLSPSQPLVIPFGSRESAAGLSLMETSAGSAYQQRSGNGGRVADAFSGFRAVFANQGGLLFNQTGRSPYGSGHDDSSSLGAAAPLHGAIFGGSAINGHIFLPPDLPEETIMAKEHNDILAKLNFASTLVNCIMELAISRSTTFTSLVESTAQSDYKNNPDEQPSMLSESCRRAEQLVLYYRALQFLSQALDFSRMELKMGRLQPSAGVKTVVAEMNANYHHCLAACKSLNSPNLLKTISTDPKAASITAEKLLYNHAIEMCQSAALEELFGDHSECLLRYQRAHVLLHSLSEHIKNENDIYRLNKYKEAVVKRLFINQDHFPCAINPNLT